MCQILLTVNCKWVSDFVYIFHYQTYTNDVLILYRWISTSEIGIKTLENLQNKFERERNKTGTDILIINIIAENMCTRPLCVCINIDKMNSNERRASENLESMGMKPLSYVLLQCSILLFCNTMRLKWMCSRLPLRLVNFETFLSMYSDTHRAKKMIKKTHERTKYIPSTMQCTPFFGRMQLNNARATTTAIIPVQKLCFPSTTLSSYPGVQFLFLFYFDIIVVITVFLLALVLFSLVLHSVQQEQQQQQEHTFQHPYNIDNANTNKDICFL